MKMTATGSDRLKAGIPKNWGLRTKPERAAVIAKTAKLVTSLYQGKN